MEKTTAGALLVILMVLLVILILPALITWGLIPFAEAAWGVELPFWPTLLTVWLVQVVASGVVSVNK